MDFSLTKKGYCRNDNGIPMIHTAITSIKRKLPAQLKFFLPGSSVIGRFH